MVFSVPNPDPNNNFGVIWILALPLGPFWLVYHCLFRHRDLAMHKVYCDIGVECAGFATQRQERIYKRLCVETDRTYRIRYAYQPPGEDFIYHMDFMKATHDQFLQLRFPVLVLPGRPYSGIPKSNILSETQRCDKNFIRTMNIMSVFWSSWHIYLVATANCPERSDVCNIEIQDILAATIFVLFIGWTGAAIYYYGQRKPMFTGRFMFKTATAATINTASGVPNARHGSNPIDGAATEQISIDTTSAVPPFNSEVLPIARADPITANSERVGEGSTSFELV